MFWGSSDRHDDKAIVATLNVVKRSAVKQIRHICRGDRRGDYPQGLQPTGRFLCRWFRELIRPDGWNVSEPCLGIDGVHA